MRTIEATQEITPISKPDRRALLQAPCDDCGRVLEWGEPDPSLPRHCEPCDLKRILARIVNAYRILQDTDGAAHVMNPHTGGGYTAGHWLGTRLEEHILVAESRL